MTPAAPPDPRLGSRLGGRLRAAIMAACVLVLVSCPAWGGAGIRTTLIVLAYNAALAQMWNLLAGYAGLVTFGQQLFVGLGGYTLAVGCERLGLGVWPSFALAAVVAGVVAVPVGALTFRLKGGYFAVGSWLVAELFRLLFGTWDFVGNATGMFIRPPRSVDPWVVYYVAVGLLVGMVALVVATLRSRTGLALMAIRDAEDAAAGLGVNVWRVKLLAFVVAAAGTGLVAALTREIMTLQAEGNYAKVKDMLIRLAIVRPEIQKALDRLKDIPVDIEPKFTTAERLMSEIGM